jgi:serine protease Do
MRLARCWGRGRETDFKAFDLERTDCQIDSHVFAGDFNTGYIRLRYEAYNAPKLGPLRFSAMYSQSFANEYFSPPGARARLRRPSVQNASSRPAACRCAPWCA